MSGPQNEFKTVSVSFMGEHGQLTQFHEKVPYNLTLDPIQTAAHAIFERYQKVFNGVATHLEDSLAAASSIFVDMTEVPASEVVCALEQ